MSYSKKSGKMFGIGNVMLLASQKPTSLHDVARQLDSGTYKVYWILAKKHVEAIARAFGLKSIPWSSLSFIEDDLGMPQGAPIVYIGKSKASKTKVEFGYFQDTGVGFDMKTLAVA